MNTKPILTIILFFLSSKFIFGQEKLDDILPTQNGVVTYSNIVQIQGATKDELYSRAKQWIVLTYKSANDVIQLDEKKDGKIIGKGYFGVSYYSRNPDIFHTISIFLKDEKVKYEISSFVYSDNQGDVFPIEDFPKSWAGKKKLYETIDKKLAPIIISLETALKTTNEDW